eukprot:m.558108 g.558108  ORF g.558108 m.558108 type:complete len:333 (+) comp22197_c0_seq4:613-1611(+)
MSSPSPSSVDSVASGTTTVPLPVPPPAESALAKENRQRREGEARLARLCTGVTERLAGVEERVDEVCHWLCDVISPHLPPNGHARTVAACVGLTKALVEFRTLAVELVRLVRVFLEPWDRKESVLTNLLHHHDMIKGDNRTLLHQLQVATTRAEKLEQQRVLVQWERLYLRLHRKRRHGHRWQFLLPSLKQRELARRRGDPVPDDDSSGDDESPDEGDAPVRLCVYLLCVCCGAYMRDGVGGCGCWWIYQNPPCVVLCVCMWCPRACRHSRSNAPWRCCGGGALPRGLKRRTLKRCGCCVPKWRCCAPVSPPQRIARAPHRPPDPRCPPQVM